LAAGIDERGKRVLSKSVSIRSEISSAGRIYWIDR